MMMTGLYVFPIFTIERILNGARNGKRWNILDHHTASDQFIRFEKQELGAGREFSQAAKHQAFTRSS
ncbi:hypothetical protein D3C73_889930 [compost metagenome]